MHENAEEHDPQPVTLHMPLRDARESGSLWAVSSFLFQGAKLEAFRRSPRGHLEKKKHFFRKLGCIVPSSGAQNIENLWLGCVRRKKIPTRDALFSARYRSFSIFSEKLLREDPRED